jgi:hypothetical protein
MGFRLQAAMIHICPPVARERRIQNFLMEIGKSNVSSNNKKIWLAKSKIPSSGGKPSEVKTPLNTVETSKEQHEVGKARV